MVFTNQPARIPTSCLQDISGSPLWRLEEFRCSLHMALSEKPHWCHEPLGIDDSDTSVTSIWTNSLNSWTA